MRTWGWINLSSSLDKEFPSLLGKFNSYPLETYPLYPPGDYVTADLITGKFYEYGQMSVFLCHITRIKVNSLTKKTIKNRSFFHQWHCEGMAWSLWTLESI